MKQKSITFRCSPAQLSRMEQAREQLNLNRTDFITHALDSFLTFAEGEEARRLDLFELVSHIDALGDPEQQFSKQA